jgi:hypothetical protein
MDFMQNRSKVLFDERPQGWYSWNLSPHVECNIPFHRCILTHEVSNQAGHRVKKNYSECVKLRDGTITLVLADRSPRPNVSIIECQELVSNQRQDALGPNHYVIIAMPRFCRVQDIQESSNARQLLKGEDAPSHPFWTVAIDEYGNEIKVCITLEVF